MIASICGPDVSGDAMPCTASSPRVLVVEDDPDMRRMAAAVLRRDGYDVAQVGTGAAMLRRVGLASRRESNRAFDLILADIQLPDVSAFDVLEGLRCRDIDIPVVLMTAYATAEAQAGARSLGAFALLQKPLDWSALRTIARRAVGLR